MNTSLYEELLNGLRQDLEQNVKEKVYCYPIPPQKKKFPLVVFEEITNQNSLVSVEGIERIDTIGYEVSIYCNEVKPENSIKKANEIAECVDNFMSHKRFSRISANRVPNIDNTIYRIVLRYSASLFVNRKRIF